MVSGWALLLHIMLAGTSVIWELCWDGSLTMSHVSCLNREDLHASAQESLFPPFSFSPLPSSPFASVPSSLLAALSSPFQPPSPSLSLSPSLCLSQVLSRLPFCCTSCNLSCMTPGHLTQQQLRVLKRAKIKDFQTSDFQTFLRLRSQISTEKHSD